MKKIRLLLTALASMLAIGSYAQTEDPWVEQAKANLIYSKGLEEFSDYVKDINGSFVYLHSFSYSQGEDVKNEIYHPIREDLTIEHDRKVELLVRPIFAFSMKSYKSMPVDDRPELQMEFASIMNDAYPVVPMYSRFYKDLVNQTFTLLKLQGGDTSTATPDKVNITKGGEYELYVYRNAAVPFDIDHQVKLKVYTKPECLVDILTDEETGFTMNSTVGVKVTIASGFPYEERVSDYETGEMKLTVRDADNKVIGSTTFKLNADPQRTRMEYVVEDLNYLEVKSTKFTFELSGPLLKDGPLVITKETEPNLRKLKEAIELANNTASIIMGNNLKYYLAYKADQLKEKAEKASECLKLPLSKQAEIDKAEKELTELTNSVLSAIYTGVVKVYDANGLIDAVKNNKSALIQLTADIDMTDVTEKIAEEFCGSINGIKDPSQPDGPTYALKGAGSSASYLFDRTVDAYFSDLTLQNFIIHEELFNLGVISRVSTSCRYRNIKVEDVIVDSRESMGFNAGTITGQAIDCEFEKINISGSVVYADGSCAGGIAGTTLACKFIDCHNDATVSIFASSKYDSDPAFSGGFSGKSEQDLFQDCENLAFVCADRDCLGGIAGLSHQSKFLNCTNAGKIFSLRDRSAFFAAVYGTLGGGEINAKEIGGICGYAQEGSVEQCSNSGVIGGTAGSIVGNGVNVVINNCLNTADNGTSCAGIVNSGDGVKITNCLSIVDRPITINCKNVKRESANNYSLLKENSERKLATYEEGIDFTWLVTGRVARWLNNGTENRMQGIEPWRQNTQMESDDVIDSYPVLDPSHHVVTLDRIFKGMREIQNINDLLIFASDVNRLGDQFSGAYLAADIDLTGLPIPWEPIGKDEDGKQFRGFFDGRGHTISGLKNPDGVTGAVGLFGVVGSNAEICNVIVGENSKFSTNDAGAGGIVGQVKIDKQWGYAIIENCGSYADIDVTQHGGGILGRVDSENDNLVKVIINDCYSMGTVTAQKGNDGNGNSGLLCGYMKNHGEVSNCWSGGQLRTADGCDNAPYSAVNPKKEGEFFVGYDKKLDIKDCQIFDPTYRVDHQDEHTLQEGVTIISDGDLSTGEFTYKLNKGVTDGSQTWYQHIGPGSFPVRTKLTDGTDIVYGIADAEGNIIRYANTSHEEITKVILGIESFEAYPATDVNGSGDVDVTDLTTFTEAANK